MADTSIVEQKEYHKNVASCTWGTYKVVSEKYIVRINTNFFSVDKNGYYEIDIDSLKGKKIVEMLAYDNANATLENICTDVGNWNNPRANRKLKISSGKIILSFTKVENPYDEYIVTLFIKELHFYDPVSNKRTSIKNDIVWKIIWEGIPG